MEVHGEKTDKLWRIGRLGLKVSGLVAEARGHEDVAATMELLVVLGDAVMSCRGTAR
jgi:hypothetical protein